MKKALIVVLVGISGFLLSFGPKAKNESVYVSNLGQSKIEWFGEKITGKHNGTIQISSGILKEVDGKLTGKFILDMNSIYNTDIQNEVYREKLDNHLKSEDFFNVEKFPTSTFEILKAEAIKDAKENEATHKITGSLTIKGISNEINFDAVIKKNKKVLVCIGSVVVDRTKFDIKYGSKSFIEGIGDKAISDEFTIKFNVLAIK